MAAPGCALFIYHRLTIAIGAGQPNTPTAHTHSKKGVQVKPGDVVDIGTLVWTE